jgi:ribosomal protein L25 (general stress protein Ctc)
MKNQETLTFSEILKNLREEPEFPENLYQRGWENITRRIRQSEALKAQKEEEKSIFRKFFDFKAPLFQWSFAAVCCSVIIFVFIFVFNPFQVKQTEPVFLSLANTDELIAISDSDNTSGSYSYKKGKIQNGKIGSATEIHFRDLRNLKSKKIDNILHVYFTSGLVSFRFNKNDITQNLYVHTPKVVFKILGTEFIIKANEKKSDLLVKKGSVYLEYSDKDVIAGKGNYWNSDDNVLKACDENKIKKIFRKFKSPKIKKLKYKKLIKTLTQKKSYRVKVKLKNGQTVIGKLEHKNSKVIIIRTKFSGLIEIQKDNIKKIIKK